MKEPERAEIPPFFFRDCRNGQLICRLMGSAAAVNPSDPIEYVDTRAFEAAIKKERGE